MAAWEIYAEQLLQLRKGYALWDADPYNEPAVEIADVGYIENGAFVRLFNASKSCGDPGNKFGVPDKYRPLRIGTIREGTLSACLPMKSESVSQIGTQVGLSGGPVIQAGASFNFECSRERGAVLILADNADSKDALHKHAFITYILENHASWLAFANEVHERGIRLTDLILVSGSDRTSGWACAAFSGSSSNIGFRFFVGNAAIAQGHVSVWGSWENCHSVEAHSGPRIIVPCTTSSTDVLRVSHKEKNWPFNAPSSHSHCQKPIDNTAPADAASRDSNLNHGSEINSDPCPSLTKTHFGLRNSLTIYLIRVCHLLALFMNHAFRHLFDPGAIGSQNETDGLPPSFREDQPIPIHRATREDGGKLDIAHSTMQHIPAADCHRQDALEGIIDKDRRTSSTELYSPFRNQCVFLRGYKICDRQSTIQRIRRFGRRKKSSSDGFTHIPQKKRDDRDDPGSGPFKSPKFPWNLPGDLGQSQSPDAGSDVGTEKGGSTSSSPVDECEGQSSCSDTSEEDAFEFNGIHEMGNNLDLYLQLTPEQRANPLDVLLDYIIENSSAELAIAHDDDVIALLQDVKVVDDFEHWLCQVSPNIIVENQVGMLETTYRDSLSVCTEPSYTDDHMHSMETPLTKQVPADTTSYHNRHIPHGLLKHNSVGNTDACSPSDVKVPCTTRSFIYVETASSLSRLSLCNFPGDTRGGRKEIACYQPLTPTREEFTLGLEVDLSEAYWTDSDLADVCKPMQDVKWDQEFSVQPDLIDPDVIDLTEFPWATGIIQ